MDILALLTEVGDDDDLVIGHKRSVISLFDEDRNEITRTYKPNINYFLKNPKLATGRILLWWEIRSWSHINDPEFINTDGTDWGYRTRESLLGFGTSDNNLVFEWAKQLKSNWTDGLEFNSYYYPDKRFKLLKILHNRASSGIVVESDNVLYMVFREMTSVSEVKQFFSGIFSLIDVSTLNPDLPKDMKVNKGIWNFSYTHGNEDGNIRSRLLEYIDSVDLDSYDEIVLMGMSLGAVIAQYACLEIVTRVSLSKITMVLFGTPRVYTSPVVNYLNRKGVVALRIEMDAFDDPPGFPCAHTPFFIQWKHIGIPIRMNAEVHLLEGVNTEGCVYYLSRRKKCNKIPYKPLSMYDDRYNLHTRRRYAMHIYHAARRFDKSLPPVNY